MPERAFPGFVIPDTLPVLPIWDLVLYPGVAAPILVRLTGSVELIGATMHTTRLVVAVTQKTRGATSVTADDLHRTGTMALIEEFGRTDEGVTVVLRGVTRVRLTEFIGDRPYLVARIEAARDQMQKGIELEALLGTAKELFQALLRMVPDLAEDFSVDAPNLTDPRQLAYFVASTIPFPMTTRQELLEIDDAGSRLRRLVEALQHELSVRRLIKQVTTETAVEMTRDQREMVLRKHMESIEKELDDLDPRRSDLSALRDAMQEAPLSEEARKEATQQLERLEHTPALTPEHGVIRNYLDWLLRMPWGKSTGAPIDLDRAREVLDDDHYDLFRIKDRILDHLAVKLLREARKDGDDGWKEADGDGARPPPRSVVLRTEPILCFVGPPGVGKTSLGQSIARALGRSFVHQSLGGVHDEAEIRGHRRTYVGAMPGRIMQGLARAGTSDPVFMLDEIDKLGNGFHGDPAAALLELLDPVENQAFSDTYLGVPFDLSHVFFVCTANTTDSIPAPLLDRMEVVVLAGYTDREKVEIARRHVIPSARASNGLREPEVDLSDDAVLAVVRRYTREAGVRSLERELGTIHRKAARRITENAPAPIVVRPDDLTRYLGPPRFFDEVVDRIDRPGVATGLCWTPAGGEMLFVEASMIPGGEDRLILTGMLGNVMRESADAALTYLRTHAHTLGIAADDLRERRVVHVHVPAGATPKDGPSAGITILVALASYALGRPVERDLAMTGEITLRGKVLPVGGVKEKVLAAHRAGLKTVILPRRNEADLDDVPDEVRRDCGFLLVESVDEVLAVSLLGSRPASLAPSPVVSIH